MNMRIPIGLNRRSRTNSSPTADSRDPILAEIRRSFEKNNWFDLHSDRIRVTFANEDLVLEGEVKDIGVKKLALEIATRFSGQVPVVDRLRVKPADRLDDVAIRDHLIQVLLEEPALERCLIHSRLPHLLETHRKSVPEPMGSIVAAVADGVVTLSGEVPTLAQKRLAGVLAWWTPGCRDVVNDLKHLPAEKDDDDKVTEAVQLALEKDPFVDATKIRVSTRDWTVTLEGLVANEAMQLRAVRDSWYVAGVKNVVNKLGLK